MYIYAYVLIHTYICYIHLYMRVLLRHTLTYQYIII